MDVVDEIKQRIDIVELIGETVKLRKSGKNYTGFCPFHPNTRTPAFVVFPESNNWRCFGACNEGGDIFRFVMKKEGWDFPEALRHLAARAGVELKPRTPEMEAAEEAHQRLRQALEAAVTLYRHHLLENPAGAPVLEYLRRRGLSDAILETFEIGFAPPGWETARQYLTHRGYSDQELHEAGLVSERDSGGFHDRFRNRIMIPIRDERGRMAGFGARIVDPQDVPKFLNSPQTAIFDKGRLLYGLDRARKAIRAANQAVIVEGYLDVIALHQAGYENAVSPMGTALSEDQLRLLKRFSRQIVLSLDADLAGDQATLRGLTVAREALDREADPVFDARGLVRHEGRLDADIRVVSLPPGKDPDEVVAEDPAEWPRLLLEARPVVLYVLEALAGGRDVDDPKVKAEIAKQVLPLIEDVRDPVEREGYRQHLARRLKVDERALVAWRPRAPRRSPRRGQAPPGEAQPAAATAPPSETGLLQRFCLGILLHKPDLLYRVDRELQSFGLDRLSGGDFTGTEGQVIFQAIRGALAQQEDEPEQHWRAQLEPALLETALHSLALASDVQLEEQRVEQEILFGFLRLRKANLAAARSELQFQMLAAQETADENVRDLQNEVLRLTRAWDRLDRGLAAGRGGARLGKGEERG